MKHRQYKPDRKSIFPLSVSLFALVLLSFLYMPALLPGAAAQKTMALFPFKIYGDPSKTYLQEGVRAMFVSRLSGPDLRMIPAEKILPLLHDDEKGGLTDQARAWEIAGTLEADFALFGSLTTLGSGYSMDLSLLDLEKDETEPRRISEILNEDRFIPRMAEVAHKIRAIMAGQEMPLERAAIPARKPSEPRSGKGLFSKIIPDESEEASIDKGLGFKPAQSYLDFRPSGRVSIGRAIVSFDAGDLDGDGQMELVALARKKILVYKMESGTYAVRDTDTPAFGEDYLKVSLGDADQDGKAEIFLVSRFGLRARTTLLSWQGRFRQLKRMNGHVRAVGDPEHQGAILLFQNSETGSFFSDDIQLLNYEGEGKTSPGEKLPKMKDAQFYTLARYDVNRDGLPEWLGLGDDSRLFVWNSQGEVVWQGDKKLGGTNNAIRIGNAPPGDLPPRIVFNSRLLISDLDGDGSKEVLAVDNSDVLEVTQDMKVYDKGRLTAFQVAGGALRPAWTTRLIKYCLMDIQAQGSRIYLAAQKGKFVEVTKGSGYIFWFD